MSYAPLRDRYNFPPDVNEQLEKLAELAELDGQKANHEDSCNCADPTCRYLVASLYSPTPEEVLAFALEQGWLTLPPRTT